MLLPENLIKSFEDNGFFIYGQSTNWIAYKGKGWYFDIMFIDGQYRFIYVSPKEECERFWFKTLAEVSDKITNGFDVFGKTPAFYNKE